MARDTEFSTVIRAREYLAAGGHCRNCGRKLLAGDRPQYDHALALHLGGESTQENCRLLCVSCHASKSASEAGQRGKARRWTLAAAAATRPKRKVAGSKGTGWRKKLDGSVWREGEGRADE